MFLEGCSSWERCWQQKTVKWAAYAVQWAISKLLNEPHYGSEAKGKAFHIQKLVLFAYECKLISL